MNEEEREIERIKKEISDLKGRPSIEKKVDWDFDMGKMDMKSTTRTINNKERLEDAQQRLASVQRRKTEKEARSKEEWERGFHERIRKEEEEKQREKDKKAHEEKVKQQQTRIQEINASVRQDLLKGLKKEYKSHSIFARARLKVTGNGPKWKMISQLSDEELQFLSNYGRGSTIQQKKKASDDEVKGRSRTIKEESKRRWDSFTTLLSSKSKMKKRFEMEQKLKNDPLSSSYRRM